MELRVPTYRAEGHRRSEVGTSLTYRAAGGERRVSSDIERRVSDTERKASDVERRVSDIRKSTKVQNPRRMCGLP